MGCLLPAVAKEPVASKAACKGLKLAILAAFTLDDNKQTSTINRHLQNGISYQSKYGDEVALLCAFCCSSN